MCVLHLVAPRFRLHSCRRLVRLYLRGLCKVERLAEIANDVVHSRHAEVWYGEARWVLAGRCVAAVSLAQVYDEARK